MKKNKRVSLLFYVNRMLVDARAQSRHTCDKRFLLFGLWHQDKAERVTESGWHHSGRGGAALRPRRTVRTVPTPAREGAHPEPRRCR